ncbi:MAG: cytochrome C [Rubrivivax sp. SCN 70-15]|nr:MAG: cytochrome C [Rubrivivax sp. SCN 70-15]
MKKLILSLLAAMSFVSVASAQEGIHWDRFPTERVTDLAALQRGAKTFVNYCMGCHSAEYMRFNRMHDIGLTDEEIKNNLIFTGVKVGDLMKIAMDPKDAKAWFGAVPPDLTLIARARGGEGKGSGADYLYTYLRTFYRDDTRPTGWNNLAFPNVGMPNVLWELQGQQRAVFAEEKNPEEGGQPIEVFKHFEPISKGKLSQAEYNDTVADLVAYLQWIGEPVQDTRVRLGVWVMLFLGLFTVIAWRLNAAFWKDIK